MPKKILVALSGGVDSAVAAYLLKKQGYEVNAAYIRTWMNEEGGMRFEECPWEIDIRYAKSVAQHLSIPFEVINLIEEYREKIVDYLVDGYRSGSTPNPDVMCNREIKFGAFLDIALKHGYDGLATGHYCCKQNALDGSADIFEGVDKSKDQSYFLAMLGQTQFYKAYFPLGTLSKLEVRAIAIQLNLSNAKRKDSQGICFLGKIKINDFLAHYIPENPGEIVKHDGTVIGVHKGLHRYTIGQRKGIGVASNTDNKFYVVVDKNYIRNRLIVTFEDPEAPRLYQQKVLLKDVTWTNKPICHPCKLLAKPRYRDPSQAITFTPIEPGRAIVKFDVPQRALARGQILALYDQNKLLGGGVYTSDNQIS